MEIKYVGKGKRTDPFSLDQLENIQVKSIIDGKFSKVEYIDEATNDRTGATYEFGAIYGMAIDFDIDDNELRVFSGCGYWMKFNPKSNSFAISIDRCGDERQNHSISVSPELLLPPPRTMGCFIIAIELYITAIYSDAFLRKGANDRYRYDSSNQPPVDIEQDSDLPF